MTCGRAPVDAAPLPLLSAAIRRSGILLLLPPEHRQGVPYCKALAVNIREPVENLDVLDEQLRGLDAQAVEPLSALDDGVIDRLSVANAKPLVDPKVVALVNGQPAMAALRVDGPAAHIPRGLMHLPADVDQSICVRRDGGNDAD